VQLVNNASAKETRRATHTPVEETSPLGNL